MTTAATVSRTENRARITRPLLILMAFAAGVSAAGNYFAQPLLGVLRTDLGFSGATAGLVVAAGQIGYAVGLALLVPLGDLLPRRRLGSALLAATGVFLLAAGFAWNGPSLLVATGLAAVSSVGAQVLVPFAAELSSPERRASNVGVVMTGVLLGGLVGRAVSGVVSDAFGWRAVYWGTAAVLAVVALLVLRMLPAEATAERAASWRALMRSTGRLIFDVPGVRRPILLAALAMASYSVHLTGLTLLLIDEPYGWAPSQIGAFSLIGVVGACSMLVVGRVVDAGHASAVLTGGLILSTVAWGAMLLAGSGRVVWLVIGVALINIGQTVMLNAAQTTAYEVRPEARNRVNAVFMTTFFVAGALGSVLTSLTWSAFGWTGEVLLAGGLVGVAAVLSLRR